MDLITMICTSEVQAHSHTSIRMILRQLNPITVIWLLNFMCDRCTCCWLLHMTNRRKLCKFRLKNWMWWCFFSYFNTTFNMVFNMTNINILNMPWNFQHSFQQALQFSTHAEIFNMLFKHDFNIVFNTYYSFQHALKFSICFQHTLKFST